MPTRRIFVLDGHPAPASLSRSFAESYAEAATSAGHEVRLSHIAEMEFDADFGRAGYASPKPLEPALRQVVDDITWSTHLVLATPMWWGGLPARLKGLFDRTFLAGLAFDTRGVRPGRLPRPLLAGRSARVILTSDTPGWYLALAYRNAILHQLRGQILGFVGFRPTRFTHFPGASHADAARVGAWIGRVRQLGAAGA